MLRELWTEHRKGFLFAIGMLCFLTAGLAAQLLPLHKEDPPEPPSQIEKKVEKTVEKTTRKPEPEQNPSSVARPPQESAVSASSGTWRGTNVLSVRTAETDAAPDDEKPEDQWFVYVTGSVRNPGVYKLPAGSRFFHLVEAAGGLNGFADPVAVNMAAPLEDGLHVHVPKKGSRPSDNPTSGVGLSAAPRGRSSSTPPGNGKFSKKAGGSVDVNRASQEELIALKGVGPALARNIVEHRQKNGPFRSVEDLLQVKGIGAKKLEGLRDSVILGP
jgi:competence protein ComEA